MKKSRLLTLCLASTLILGIITAPASMATMVLENRNKTVAEDWVNYKSGEVIVKFNPDATEQQKALVTNQFGLKTLKKHALTKTALYQIESGAQVEDVVEQLNNKPGVAYAQPNYLYKAHGTVDDPKFGELWGLENTGQLINGVQGTVDVDVNAPAAWDISQGSSDIVVAVIDTGVDINHPDLAANIWTNSGEIAGDGIDNDGNGYVDDIHGWDMVDGDNTLFHPEFTGDEHGTHVAGTIAAIANNATGVAGVAPKVKIMPVRFLDINETGSTSDAISALEYAAQMGAQVSNNSWGSGSNDPALKDAISASGQVIVASAGNDTQDTDKNPTYPAAFDYANILSVAALDNRGALATFSNYGATTVDVGAPGVNVLSLRPLYPDNNPLLAYQYNSGTSMAAPHVSGIAALLLSVNPNLSPEQVVNIIKNTARPLPSLLGKTVTGGIADAYQALTNMSTVPTGLTVESTVPVNGAVNVPVNTQIIVNFTEDIQAGSNIGMIEISYRNNIVAVNSSIVGNQLVISPVSSLGYNKTYTVKIPADAVASLSGKSLATEYSFSFSTQRRR